MSSIRNLSVDPVAQGLVTNWNKVRLDMMKIKLGTVFHADATTLVTAASSDGTPATQYALVLNESQVFNTHCASACSATTGQGAHVAADATNAPIAATAVAALSTSATRLLLIKTKYTAHVSQSGKHMTNDGTNAITLSTDGTQEGNDALADEIKTVLNAHIGADLTSEYIELVAP